MKKAEIRLSEEENRVDMYLHASTRKGLVQKCEDVLVRDHSGLLQEEFQRVRQKFPFLKISLCLVLTYFFPLPLAVLSTAIRSRTRTRFTKNVFTFK